MGFFPPKVKVAQLYLTVCHHMDCSPPRLLCPWGFSRQEYLCGLPYPPPDPDLPDPGIEPGSPALQADSLPTELPEKPLSPQCLTTDRSHLILEQLYLSPACFFHTHLDFFFCWSSKEYWEDAFLFIEVVFQATSSTVSKCLKIKCTDFTVIRGWLRHLSHAINNSIECLSH